MAILFPGGLDNFTNPSAADNLNTPAVLHSDQHANENDAIEALEAKVGTDGSLVTGSFDYRINYLEGNQHSSVTLGIANGLSLSGQQLSMGLAGANATGTLSATDWNTFNNKVPSTRMISGAFPISGGGDLSADRTLSIPQAGTGTSGYLSSVDFNTFNSKQSLLTFPLASSLGGSGVNNSGTFTHQSNTIVTGGGTIALGGFTLTVPATGTADLIGTAQTITATKTYSAATEPIVISSNTAGTAGQEMWKAVRPSTTAGVRLKNYDGTAEGFRVEVSSNLSAWTHALTFRNNGFVGIGTGANIPAYALDVLSAATDTVRFKGSQTTAFMVLDTTGVGSGDSGFKQLINGTLVGLFAADGNNNVYIRNRSVINSNAITIDANGIVRTDTYTTTTNAIKEVLRVRASVSTASTGGANGFGAGLSLYAETATDDTYQQQGLISTSWINATNASRKAKMSLSAYDTAARLGIEIEASGTAPMLGFYGVAPVIRATNAGAAGAFVANTSGIANDTATFGGYTLGQIVQALINIGILT